MLSNSSATRRLARWLGATSLVAAAFTSFSTPAGAHFVLKTPASWKSQTDLGNPQKLGPCGDDGGTVTGEITGFAPGETVTITIEETIFHAGHYRIALSVKDRSELPAEPIVTPADTPCGSVDIMDPPVFPVLADGVLAHTAPFNGPQTVQVTLPADVTCDKCTLQIIEFMSNHGLNNRGGCFYHHCADISIKPGGGTTGSAGGTGGTGGTGGAGGTTGAGASPTTSAATTGGGGTSTGGTGGAGGGAGGADKQPTATGGCGCSMPAGDAPPFAALACVLGLAMLRRRRR